MYHRHTERGAGWGTGFKGSPNPEARTKGGKQSHPRVLFQKVEMRNSEDREEGQTGGETSATTAQVQMGMMSGWPNRDGPAPRCQAYPHSLQFSQLLCKCSRGNGALRLDFYPTQLQPQKSSDSESSFKGLAVCSLLAGSISIEL